MRRVITYRRGIEFVAHCRTKITSDGKCDVRLTGSVLGVEYQEQIQVIHRISIA